MNDNIIINTISKIHFIIISIISFIFSILFTIFVILQNGLYLDDISFVNIKAKQLYIKWDEKVSITIKDINIELKPDNKQTKINFSELGNLLKKIPLLDSIFDKVIINHIVYNDIHGTFKYIDNSNGFINLQSPDFKLQSTLLFDDELLNIHINNFSLNKKDINISGNLILDINNIELISSLFINVNNEIDLNLYVTADTNKLSYKIDVPNNIKSVKTIIDKYVSNWEAKWWVRDAIDMSSLKVLNTYGYIEFDDMSSAFKRLHVDAVVNDLKYTYDENLDVIDTTHTELEFKDGELYIRPKNAYTYGMFLDKSWLKIDFTKDDPCINLFLKFTGQLNQDLLNLLSNYKIDLPLKQTKGELRTDLTLDINLFTTEVDAYGDFYTKDAWIKYIGLDLHVFDTHVVLKNTDVKVKNMYAKYKDIARTHLDINFDAKNNIGILDFRLDSTNFKEINLKLVNTKKPLHVEYIISPKQDYIKVDRSTWKFNGIDIDLEKMKLPFDMKSISAGIPRTKIESNNLASAYISGKFLLNPIRTFIDVDLKTLNYYHMELNQEKVKVKFIYDDKIKISSKEKIDIKMSDNTYELENMNIDIYDSIINIKELKIRVPKLLKSNFNFQYNINNQNGFINLNSLVVKNNIFGEIFKKYTPTKFNIDNSTDDLIVQSKEYGVKYIINDYKWKLNIDSITPIAKESKLLQQYFLTNGSLEVSKIEHEKNINLLLKSDYKYKMLILDNNPIKSYVIDASIDTNSNAYKINVNDILHINIKDDIKITTKNIGIDINQITNFLSDLNSSKDSKNNTKKVYFNAKDSYIYLSEKRHAISDTIEFHYIDNILSAQLKHEKGLAEFNYSDNNFKLWGKGFNDTFMNELFKLSEVKDGTFGFSVSGPPKNYKGVIYIKDSAIMDYKILNNILAFVNTVPALVTFSLPGYSKNGLNIKRFYLDFELKNDIYKIQNISLKSKEIQITGQGEASIVHNDIDVDLNLKSNLGSSVSKIPIVGYILLGKDSISTSLTLKGKLNDPEINTHISKDIIVAPLNIIKRAFMYPFELFKSEDK